MSLVDKVNFVGHFSIKAFKKDGTFEEYSEKNLIVEGARTAMAESIAGVGTSVINKFVLGTEGHVGNDILNNRKVGENGFDATRTNLFSEQSNSTFYTINFDVSGPAASEEDSTAIGALVLNGSSQGNDLTRNTIIRTVTNNTVTYNVTVPVECGNATGSLIAYTEAALYAGSRMFSMKTFPARVKEDTVRFEITWSIIF